jgi:hypothetical protein
VVVEFEGEKRGFRWPIVAKVQIVGPNITSFWYIFVNIIWTKILHPKKAKVTDCCQIRSVQHATCLQNWQNCFFKMYFLPWYKSYTFETYINVQLKSPCRSVLEVLSKFLSRFKFLYFKLPKIIKFQLISYEIFLKLSKNPSWKCINIERVPKWV